MGLAAPFEEADGQDDSQLPGEGAELREERVPFDRMRVGEVRLPLHLAPVQVFEQLGQQDQSSATIRRLADEGNRVLHVVFEAVRHGHLHDGDGERACGHGSLVTTPAGCCCVTQWHAPPPVMRCRAITPRTSRPGNRGRRISSAQASFVSPYTGTITPAFTT